MLCATIVIGVGVGVLQAVVIVAVWRCMWLSMMVVIASECHWPASLLLMCVHIDEWGDVHIWILRMDASDDDCDVGEEIS